MREKRETTTGEMLSKRAQGFIRPCTDVTATPDSMGCGSSVAYRAYPPCSRIIRLAPASTADAGATLWMREKRETTTGEMLSKRAKS